jgi:CSLREA domain-containing protein
MLVPASWLRFVTWLVVAVLTSATPVLATSIAVTTTTDELNADGDCSLREAVRAANIITGAGAATTIIQSCAVEQQAAACPAGQGIAERVFHIIDAQVAISGITVRHGRQLSLPGQGIFIQKAFGTAARLSLSDSLITKNA